MTFNDLKKNLKKDTGDLPKLRVALLGDTATQLISIAIKGYAIENGYSIDLFDADYNQIEQLILDPSSDLYSFNADYIIIYQSSQKLLQRYNKSDSKHLLAGERLSFVKTACSLIKAPIIYVNYPELDDNIFGNYANKTEISFIFQLRKINYDLMVLSTTQANLHICDLSFIQNHAGREKMFDPSLYATADMALSIDIIPSFVAQAMNIIWAMEGKIKKCLIIDLDNTIWGGIIGDDGIENIQLGSLGIGKVYSEFQWWIKKLKDRGIIIAVCSKNDKETAEEPFEKHPDMVLKLDDISVFIANWENKADNIRHIQSILNIGFNSMVFLDDNPFERNLVRENLPEVTVPELPEDPAFYLEYLSKLNLFETTSYSEADQERTKQYQTEAKRVLAKEKFTNEADFLKSLNMISEISGLDKFTIPRIAQLSQRSNQFNLRTVRYSEDDLIRMEKDPSYKLYSFTLKDKFGDNGLIAVVVLKKEDPHILFIESWFMSCRVLKRGMESFILNRIVEYAKENNIIEVSGEYIPSPKNQQVANLYPSFGFTEIVNNKYHLKVSDYTENENYIQINYENR